METECTNGPYIDPYGSWSEVLVDGWITITLRDYKAKINLNTNNIHLETGTRCRFTDESCIDLYGGYAFWETAPTDDCNKKYSKLYTGPSLKVTEENSDKPVYTVETKDITFAFAANGHLDACSHRMIRTEHPKLFIIENENNPLAEFSSETTTENLDLFTYINSKFVYVEKYLKNQMKRLYHDMLFQKCQLEKKVIANALSIAISAPDQFAYQITGGPGFMGLVAGEVIHLIQCVPVPVKFRQAEDCFQEMPVYKNKKLYFMSPRAHILSEIRLRTSCNKLVPPMFFVGDKWYKLIPVAIETRAPEILKPETKASWKYIDAKNLAESGLYSPSQLDNLKQHIMFPIERKAVLNSIARGMLGKNITGDRMDAMYLLNPKVLESIMKSTWERFWGKFISFGTASAGLLGVFVVFRVIKFTIDTIIHGYAIYSLYGFSVEIIGAIWDSVTQLLLHLENNRRNRHQQNETNAPPVPGRRRRQFRNLLYRSRPSRPQIQNMESQTNEEPPYTQMSVPASHPHNLYSIIPENRNNINNNFNNNNNNFINNSNINYNNNNNTNLSNNHNIINNNNNNNINSRENH